MIVSTRFGGSWITVAYDRKGRLFASSLPSQTLGASRASVMESLEGRGISSTEEGGQEGSEIAARVQRSALEGGGSIVLALDGMTGFEGDVYSWVRNIPRGKVASYGDVARGIGNPRAARAVGNAMAKNPFLMVVPCHRVVKSDLRPGGFGLNPGEKVRLLLEEGVQIAGGRIKATNRLAPSR